MRDILRILCDAVAQQEEPELGKAHHSEETDGLRGSEDHHPLQNARGKEEEPGQGQGVLDREGVR